MISAKELREKMRQDRNARIEKKLGKGSRAYKRMLERIEAGIKNAVKLGQVSFLFQFNENEADHALIALVMDELEELGYKTEQVTKMTAVGHLYGIYINWYTDRV